MPDFSQLRGAITGGLQKTAVSDDVFRGSVLGGLAGGAAGVGYEALRPEGKRKKGVGS